MVGICETLTGEERTYNINKEDYMQQPQLTFGSVCSGIEAASMAWEPIGWKADWFAEIEPFPAAVLKHHWPTTPNHSDMTLIKQRVSLGLTEAPDLLVGGTPCQAFSIAGLRKSLDDERGQLTLEYVRLLNAIDDIRRTDGRKPAIAVWENVPGCLNTKDNAFGCFLGALSGEEDPLEPPRGRWTNAGCVSGPQRKVAWRVLDAQYFGVAQRRRRVFVVASADPNFRPEEVLFELEGVQRNTPPSREQEQDATATAARGTGESIRVKSFQQNASGELRESDVCYTLNTNSNPSGRNTPMLYENHPSDSRVTGPKDTCPSAVSRWGTGGGNIPLVQHQQGKQPFEVANCLTARMHKGINSTVDEGQTPVLQPPKMHVRRLTSTECERLQGFPDDHTDIPFGRPKYPDQLCPEGHRYKALGNSMAVPVMRWIGERIQKQLILA